MGIIEKCPNCGQEIEKWVSTSLGQSGSGLFLESIKFKRMCPHCWTEWRRKFANRRGMMITLSALALSILAGLFAAQSSLGFASSVGFSSGTDAAKLAVMVGFTVALLLGAVSIFAGIHFFTRWQLTHATLLCKFCGEPIAMNDARFCPRCGSDQSAAFQKVKAPSLPRLDPRKLSSVPLPAQNHVEKCAVCHLHIGPAEEIIWCPHCGAKAHRDHFLEFLHVKGQCPTCQQHVDERELSMLRLQERKGEERLRRKLVLR